VPRRPFPFRSVRNNRPYRSSFDEKARFSVRVRIPSSLAFCVQLASKIHLSKLGSASMMPFLFMKLHVIVMPKRSVLDPQGVAVRNAIRETGLETLEHVRVGKFLELEFSREPDPVRLEEICRDLLSNPVIEDYVVERGS
jgi:phosphoribosylformylglycinamidine synthase PurS subunit